MLGVPFALCPKYRELSVFAPNSDHGRNSGNYRNLPLPNPNNYSYLPPQIPSMLGICRGKFVQLDEYGKYRQMAVFKG